MGNIVIRANILKNPEIALKTVNKQNRNKKSIV